MDLNKMISKAGSAIVTVTVLMKPENKADKWLKALLMIHGVFYFSCTFMPITGIFARMSSGGNGIGGRLALVVWCVYFLPVGILSFVHFHFGKGTKTQSY